MGKSRERERERGLRINRNINRVWYGINALRVVPIIVSVSFTLEPCATFLLSWLPQFLFGRVLKSSKFSLGKVEKEKIILRVHVILFIYMLWGRKAYSKDSLHVVLFIVIIYHEIYESILKILIFYSPIKKKSWKRNYPF